MTSWLLAVAFAARTPTEEAVHTRPDGPVVRPVIELDGRSFIVLGPAAGDTPPPGAERFDASRHVEYNSNRDLLLVGQELKFKGDWELSGCTPTLLEPMQLWEVPDLPSRSPDFDVRGWDLLRFEGCAASQVPDRPTLYAGVITDLVYGRRALAYRRDTVDAEPTQVPWVMSSEAAPVGVGGEPTNRAGFLAQADSGPSATVWVVAHRPLSWQLGPPLPGVRLPQEVPSGHLALTADGRVSRASLSVQLDAYAVGRSLLVVSRALDGSWRVWTVRKDGRLDRTETYELPLLDTSMQRDDRPVGGKLLP